MPANNNYKVFNDGAEKIGYKVLHRPDGDQRHPYDGRPASMQDGFNFQGDKRGAKWRTRLGRSPRARRPATWKSSSRLSRK